MNYGLLAAVPAVILLANLNLNTQAPPPTRTVHAPYFGGGAAFANEKGAIFWFGRVNQTENYTDVRVGYNDNELIVYLAIFDNKLWYDETPTVAELTQFDAATVYLSTDEFATTLSNSAHKFSAQVANASAAFKQTYTGSGGNWVAAHTTMTAKPGWRGQGFNNNSDARGWTMLYRIPFASLGLAKPNVGVRWRMAVVVHDRDDEAGTPIADKHWPENYGDQQPQSWGVLSFGLPSFVPPSTQSNQTVEIAHKLNGAVVSDAAVGGGTVCGSGTDFWTEWGDHVAAGSPNANVQNQVDVADWPCFSKFYILFPLGAVPQNKTIVSATLTLHQMGNSGDPGQAKPSLIQVLAVAEDWDEATLSWNNAPLALENFGGATVDPLNGFPGWPGVPRVWDVSYAAAQAHAAKQPLRLVLYSADEAYHSGKYFVTSDTGDWNAKGRPRLSVAFGDAVPVGPTATPNPAVVPRTFLPVLIHNRYPIASRTISTAVIGRVNLSRYSIAQPSLATRLNPALSAQR